MKLSDNVFGMQVAFFFAENSEISILDLATEVKGLFRAMFPNDPQMFLLPDDAPKDIPRCIFQKSDGSAKLSFGLARMDFNAGLKEATPWKNNFEIVIYALAQICKNKNIDVTRIGLVVQTFADKE